jgi:hypothetical protein
VGALGLGLALSLPAETALACEPPPPNVIRLSPFVTQGQALLPAKDRPLLPRNVDFAIAVLHAQGVDLSAFRLRPDYPLKTEKELPLRAEAQGDEIRVTVRATQPLRAGVGYSVYGVLSGKRQRILQFHTRPAEDRTPPSAVQVTPKAHLGRFTPVLGLCDDGHPRLFLSVQATDDSTRADHLRYLLEGAGQPQLLSSWCGLLELRSDGILSAPLRIRAVDLAGNRGPAVSVSAPAMSAGSWDAVRGQRECTQAR